MTIDNIHPAHAINRYLWSRIEAEGILSKSNYSGLTPIIPVEETPDFIQVVESQPGIGSFPYIVYSWSRVNSGQMWFMKTHNVAYSIRSADDYKMGQLLNLFEREFQSYDMAAQRINQFIATNGTASQKRFNFTTINVQVLGAPMPAESETGVSEALVTISVNYTETIADPANIDANRGPVPGSSYYGPDTTNDVPVPGTRYVPAGAENDIPLPGSEYLGPEEEPEEPTPEDLLDDFGGYDMGGPYRAW